MFGTFLSVCLALLINFYSPEIRENKELIRNNDAKNKIITGFPYQYFKGEVLTDEMVLLRFRSIFIYFCIILISVGFSASLTSTSTTSTTSVERLIPNQLDYQTNQEELLLDLRGGGGSDVSEFIIKILLIWTMSKNYNPTDGFQPKPRINQHFGRQERQGYVQPNARIAPKLQENHLNNPGQGSCRSSNHISIDRLANSLSPEYSEFQNKYYSESLPKRFDTNNYSVREFKKLATDSRVYGGKYTRASIDEARTIVQAKLQNLIIQPTRADLEIARRIDLDYKVQGPAPFTHFDVKNPVGSEILKKQLQTISLEDMSYNIGENIVIQKNKFVGLKDGPAGPENVGHIVDLCYVPSSEKQIVKQNVLKGAAQKGNDTGIIFLNDI
uniref:Uncharacterized protein n=1 Tax=Climaconeis cf. scalaris TaxID=2846828 RepID=A0A8F8X848_9STRA|nr:hypothetical protein [Climaconeis cf. scalaris]